MKKELVLQLGPGIYRVEWKDGSESIASVGIGPDGTRWIAPTNWVAPSSDPILWRDVKRVQRID